MSICEYEMKMPARYVELTADEMEYDGGFLNIPASIGLFVGGTVATVLGNHFDNDFLKTVGATATVVGVASTGIGAATSAIKIAKTAPALTSTLTKSEKTLTWAATGGVSMDVTSVGIWGALR